MLCVFSFPGSDRRYYTAIADLDDMPDQVPYMVEHMVTPSGEIVTSHEIKSDAQYIALQKAMELNIPRVDWVWWPYADMMDESQDELLYDTAMVQVNVALKTRINKTP